MKRAVLVLVVCGLSACTTYAPNDPGPTAAPSTLSSYVPANPYQQLAPNLWSRTIFTGPDGSGMTVRVRHFMVGPTKHGDFVLDGASVFEVLTGAGTLTIDGSAHPVAGGATLSAAMGAHLSFNNPGPNELVFKVTTVIGPG